MSKDDVLKVVRKGDCYKVMSKHRIKPFNIYVSRIGSGGLWQDTSDSELELDFVSYEEIESITHL